MYAGNKSSSVGHTALLPLALAISTCSAAGLAQEESALVIEEVVVTAQKRQQSLQDVPVAVQSVSGEQLQSSGVDNLSYLEQVSSSITMNDATGYALPSVRGVGSTNQGHGSYSSVAIYVDEVYVTRTLSALFGFDSVEQIQVLRGPQGALYGRNATGGALVVTTKSPEPGQEFEGSIEGTIGDFDQREFAMSLSSGLGDDWAASLKLATTKRDGFIESTTPGRDDLDGRDALSGVAKLVYSPTDTSTYELSVWYDESDDTNAHGYQQVNSSFVDSSNQLNQLFTAFGLPNLNNPQLLAFSAAAGGACFAANGFPCDGATLGGFLVNPANFPTVAQLNGGAGIIQFDTRFGFAPNNNISGAIGIPATFRNSKKVGDLGAYTFTEDVRASFKATIGFDSFDFVSITAASDSYYEGSTDIFNAQAGTVPFGGDNLGFSAIFESESQSQEFRIISTDSHIEWLAALHYFHDEGTSLLNADVFGLSLRQADNEFDVDSWSAYGQAKIPLSDAFNLTIGARWTDETYELQDNIVDGSPINAPGLVNLATANTIPGFPGAPFDTEQDFSQTTGGVILDWTVDDLLLYGSINTGFKSGNLNAQNPLSGGVDQEDIVAYEIGFKSDLADGRIRLNGAAFLYDYENIHIQVVNTNSGATILLNGSNAEIQGVELELLALISESLTLNAGLTALDSEYKDDVLIPDGIAPGVDAVLPIAGSNVAGAPEFALTVGMQFTRHVGGGELTVNGNLLASGGYFYEAENRVGTGGNDDDGYTVLNASVSYRTDNWRVSLWANNVTDEKYYRSGLVANGLSEVATAAAPRHYGLTVGFNF